MRIISSLVLALALAHGQTYDVAIMGGRVMDPESNLDGTRNIGIRGGKIATISQQPLTAQTTINANGLVVSPGFIDLHWHGQNPSTGRYQAMDGVTSALELEIGVADLDAWYQARAGKSILHYGAAIGHPPVRMAVMKDPGAFLPAGPAAHRQATEHELTEIKRMVEHGLRRGAPAVGIGAAYTEAATYSEILDIFRLAARYKASVHVHIRGASSAALTSADRVKGLSEAIAASAITGAAVQVVHINSSGQEATGAMLDIIAEAREHGIDVTTEAYPYTAGSTRIESAVFDSWMDRAPSDYQRIQWTATGERLTRDTFLKYRKQGGSVIIHANTEERVRLAIVSPLTMIASDGFDIANNTGHPRSTGTYSRVLGRYVREQQTLTLMDAIRKMTLMPARRLETRVPSMRAKGRIREGADADIAIFDPARVTDRSTYENPGQFSEGMRWVLVDGKPVVRDGRLVEGVFAGQPIRAAVQE
ncbi:MAG TPA: amidohydrolase family protein [Bryobacteraceae bacterium]|nr:amidohydrolase family protein [Bryobacteraceae bacterium]